jgi:hypothetical protein
MIVNAPARIAAELLQTAREQESTEAKSSRPAKP